VSRKPPKAIHCPAGEWTRVEFYLGSKQEIHKFYEADPAAVNVQYRIYSSFLPPFQEGEFRLGRGRDVGPRVTAAGIT
jgi:hypothetical protein